MQLLGEFSPFIEKKVVFCLVVGGGGLPPSPLLVVRPLKKPLFLCVSSLSHNFERIWVCDPISYNVLIQLDMYNVGNVYWL